MVPVDRDCLLETCDRFIVPVERLQGSAAIGPAADMLRRACQYGIEAGDCLIRTFEIEQGGSAVVQGLDIARRPGKDRGETRERVRMAPKLGACDAAIKQRLGARRIACEHLLVTCERFLGAIERTQRIATVEQGFLIAWFERECLVET